MRPVCGRASARTGGVKCKPLSGELSGAGGKSPNDSRIGDFQELGRATNGTGALKSSSSWVGSRCEAGYMLSSESVRPYEKWPPGTAYIHRNGKDQCFRWRRRRGEERNRRTRFCGTKAEPRLLRARDARPIASLGRCLEKARTSPVLVVSPPCVQPKPSSSGCMYTPHCITPVHPLN